MLGFKARLITGAAFLGLAILARFSLGFPLPWPIFPIIGLWFVSIFLIRHRLRRLDDETRSRRLRLRRLVLELFLLTAVLHLLGGIEWIGVVLYFPPVVEANILSPGRRGLGVALLASVLYASLPVIEYLGLLPHHQVFLPFIGAFRDLNYVVITTLVGGAAMLFVGAYTAGGFARAQRERQAYLEELNRLKSLFIAHVSHELKTPLASIQLTIENLRKGLVTPLSGKAQTYLSGLRRDTSHLTEMIDKLLNLTRIEAGQIALAPRPVRLATAVEEVFRSLSPLAEECDVLLEGLDRLPACLVLADRYRLQEILTNLLHNGIKFTRPGGSVRISAESLDGMVSIHVSDQGPGIAPEAADSLFEPFHKGEGSREGLGLGLYIVRRLVELHNGRIEVSSQPDRGTTFSVLLPKAEAPG